MKKIWGILLLCCFASLAACNKEPQPEETMKAYIQAWNKQEFSKMYEQLSSDSKKEVSKEDFVKRYENIYSSIEVSQVTAELAETKEKKQQDKEKTDLHYKAKINTVAGTISFDHHAALVKEKKGEKEEWKIVWNPSLLFPSMQKGDEVRIKPYPAKRGEILDQKGNGLAINGTAYQVGIVPEKLGETAQTTKESLAKMLGITTEEIDKKLKEKWVQSNLFVPLAILPDEANHNDYTSLPGVKIVNKPMRTYPLKEAAGHLTGYVGEITAEELKTLKGYKAGDTIGKRGLEQVYENELRGENGGRIYIIDANKKEKGQLAEKPAKDGETLTVTINTNLQKELYNEMKSDAGTAGAVDPKTGNVLALVSSPSFDPNTFVRGMKSSQWEALNADQKKPLLNRFTQAYAPGSVFKPITAAIGLNTKTLNPQEEKQIPGLQWAKDSSWGNYYVTRVKDASPINLEKAMVYSDNVYFAQEGLKIGKEKFAEEAKKFGFAEKLPLKYPFQESTIAAKGIKNDIQLADTAYGQGEVVMTSLHLALSYAPFVTGGTIPVPSLKEGENTGKAWKENVISAENAKMLNAALVKVVNDAEGTGRGAKIEGASLAGKTGTAELKREKGEEGQENGWFVAYDAVNPNMIVAVMIEDVKTRGGSSYVVNKVKHVFENTMRK
ncbi:penicillin-binding transpeptidase domain-containing protein [Ectobacillus panaciterrae]|uniref:penicillin-binding transpeptidase domain-containing protein n=1 Tax=Ectobacillus panaciterrae TaxID=363872 RepID=UPI0004066053|nr:penicillin-binding transpeptidase domain-containing protein [Ectobacillus panaciterrae]